MIEAAEILLPPTSKHKDAEGLSWVDAGRSHGSHCSECVSYPDCKREKQVAPDSPTCAWPPYVRSFQPKRGSIYAP